MLGAGGSAAFRNGARGASALSRFRAAECLSVPGENYAKARQFSAVPSEPKKSKESVFGEDKKPPKSKEEEEKEWKDLWKQHSPIRAFSELSRTNYKIWPTDPRLSPSGTAKTFPLLDLLSVGQDGNKSTHDRLKGKTSLVCVAFRKHGSEMGSTWGDFFVPQFKGDDRVQFVKLVMYESWVHRVFLQGFALRGLRGRVPEEEQGHWQLCFDKRVHEAQKELGIENNMANYAFLIDEEARIRWAASGGIHEHEGDGELLVKLTNQLLQEGLPEEDTRKKGKGKPLIGQPKRKSRS